MRQWGIPDRSKSNCAEKLLKLLTIQSKCLSNVLGDIWAIFHCRHNCPKSHKLSDIDINKVSPISMFYSRKSPFVFMNHPFHFGDSSVMFLRKMSELCQKLRGWSVASHELSLWDLSIFLEKTRLHRRHVQRSWRGKESSAQWKAFIFAYTSIRQRWSVWGENEDWMEALVYYFYDWPEERHEASSACKCS